MGNYSPLTQIFGLPTLDPSGNTRSSELTLGLQLISVSNSDSDADESLILDGELTRLDISYLHQLPFAERWLRPAQIFHPRIRVQLPFYYQSGGFMDDSIETFHDIFNLPNGNRDELETNNLLYRYVRNGQTLVDYQDETGGVGDASIELSVDALRNTEASSSDSELTSAGNQHLTFSLGVKLPTGDESSITGSGGTDVYALIAADNPIDLRQWGISNHLNIGYLRAENGGPLANIQSSEIFFGRLNIDIKLNPRWSIISHFYYHQAPYESDMEAIGDDAVIGNFGASYRADGHTLKVLFWRGSRSRQKP